jgi:uncharacterized protein
MILGILHFEVLVHGATSLKDKRRVVQSLKDRLHREHLCSIAEVGDPDILNCAVMGLAVVCRDGKRAGEVLDAISLKLRETRDGEVASIRRHVLHAMDSAETAESESDTIADPKSGDGSDHETDALMLDRALDADLLRQIEEAHRELDRSLGTDASTQGFDNRRSA